VVVKTARNVTLKVARNVALSVALNIVLASGRSSLCWQSQPRSQPAGRRRALLVGIDDYSASHFDVQPRLPPVPGRDWPNLKGAAGDAGLLEEMLGLIYRFDRRDIGRPHGSSRDAHRDPADARRTCEHRVQGRRSTLLLCRSWIAGSKLLSDELDELDESTRPCGFACRRSRHSRQGAATIFNRILDRGARLTVILDNCHSGSGARGLATGADPEVLSRTSGTSRIRGWWSEA